MGLLARVMGWKGYVATARFGELLAGAAAWTAQGWRYGAQIAGLRVDGAGRLAESQHRARELPQRRHFNASFSAAGAAASESGDSTRLVDGSQAELDPDARSAYFAIRGGIQQMTAELAAC